MSSNENFLKLTSHWSKVFREMDAAPIAAPVTTPVPVPNGVPTLAPTPTRCAECGAPDQTPGNLCVYCNHAVVA